MRGSRTILLTLAITAALVVLAAGLRGLYPRLLAEHCRSQLDTVPDDRAAPLLEGVAQLGQPGIPVLVQAMGSERECVAAGARLALFREMRRWERLPARQYSPKLAILAKALAERVDQFGPTARADARELATRIVTRWSLDRTVVDPTQVIDRCEKVLRATSSEGRLLAEKRLPDATGRGVSGEEHGPVESAADLGLRRPSPGDLSPRTNGLLQGIASPAGGGLPIEELDVTRQQADRFGSPRLAEAPLDEPRRLHGTGPLGHPLRPLSEHDHAAAISRREAAPSEGPGPTDRPSVKPLGLLVEEPRSDDEGPGGSPPSIDLAEVDTVELMRRLQAADDRTAAAARTELVRRGFSDAHLALARRMFDPDPKVRIELARLLTEMPEVNAVAWLLQLSRDEHPAVRLSAISLLATTGEPAVLEAIEAMAREDPDPSVRRQAERIAQRRREAGY